MIRGVSAAKRAPPWQDLRAMHSRKAICRAFRIHGAHILPKPAHFGYMVRESCQGGALFPSQAPFGIHRAQKLPRIAARERIAAKSCHGLPPGNASREHIATVGCRGTHFANILPSVSARNATAPCTATLCVAAPPMLAPNAPAHAPRARRSCPRPARRGTTAPCAVRGAFAAAEKVSCGLRVSMRWNEPPVSV